MKRSFRKCYILLKRGVKWCMAIDIAQTQIVHFRRIKDEKLATVSPIGNESFKLVSCYKYLGVLFDEHFNFEHNALVLADGTGHAHGSIRTKLSYIKDCGFNSFNTLFQPGVQSITDKQRVLMHRHHGWNVRHGLCHIYMRYLYIYMSCL